MDLKTTLRTQSDRVAAAAFVLLGLLALMIGYFGISGTARSYEQLPYLVSGGVLGALFIGVGATLYLSADLRDEWRKLDSLEQALLHAADVVASSQPAVVDPEIRRPAQRRATSAS